jgi:hypothetical protein
MGLRVLIAFVALTISACSSQERSNEEWLNGCLHGLRVHVPDARFERVVSPRGGYSESLMNPTEQHIPIEDLTFCFDSLENKKKGLLR